MKLTPDLPLYNGTLNTNLGTGVLGPLDVSGFESLMIAFYSDNLNPTTVQCSWGDEVALDPAGGPTERIVSGPQLSVVLPTPLIVAMRNLGPFLRVNWSTLAATRAAAMWLTNRHHAGDGPVTPGRDGQVLGTITGVGQIALPPYAGPATLHVRNNTGAGSVAGLVGVIGGAEIAGLDQVAAGGAGTSNTVQFWMPPVPVQLVFAAGGGGGGVATVTAGHA